MFLEKTMFSIFSILKNRKKKKEKVFDCQTYFLIFLFSKIENYFEKQLPNIPSFLSQSLPNSLLFSLFTFWSLS